MPFQGDFAHAHAASRAGGADSIIAHAAPALMSVTCRAWGALYLGNEHCLTWAARGQPVGEGVTPLWTALCPVAYMLRRESAWRLLDSFLAKRSYCQSFDLQAAWTYEHGWNTFRSHPEGPFEAVEQDPYAVLLFGTDPFLFASASESIING